MEVVSNRGSSLSICRLDRWELLQFLSLADPGCVYFEEVTVMIHKNYFQEFIYLILPSPENQKTFSSEKGPVRKSPRQFQDRTVAFESVVRFGWRTNHAHESGQKNMIAKCIDLTNDGICSQSSHACSRFDEAIVASDF